MPKQIQVKLTPSHGGEASNRGATNPDAYDLYLKGRFYLGKRTGDGIKKGIEYFKQSIEKDPGFALGYAGLANSYLASTILSPRSLFQRPEQRLPGLWNWTRGWRTPSRAGG